MEKVLVINSESMGKGDEALGKRLIGAFLRKLWANPERPSAIIFYNSGVKLAAEGSEVLDAINGLYEAGVDLLACGTCVDYYGLRNKLVSVRISNMDEISSIMLRAEKLITV